MAGHADRGTGGAPSSLGRCYVARPNVECRVWGIGVRTRCASVQVVHESGSVSLAANLEMTLSGFVGDAWRPSAGPAITRSALTSSPAATTPAIAVGPTASPASRP
jgi:hypothetical protein